ncbi:hypothetical protein MMC30_007498 [Trapelia coarctata]|nr:hypothetical protein [Trapelia coarctata]
MSGMEASVGGNHMAAQGYKASARLHFQHWMWSFRLNWLLHPDIPLLPVQPHPDDGIFRIADLGAGNAPWLYDLQRSFPPAWAKHIYYHGIDISTDLVSHHNYQPDNFTIAKLDLFEEIPAGFLGAFHVVHLRGWATIIKGGDPSALIANAVKMLRPGGYLQWDELDVVSLESFAPNSDIESKASKEMELGLDFDWILALATTLTSQGLIPVHNIRAFCPDALRRASTDDHLQDFEEMAARALSSVVAAAAAADANIPIANISAAGDLPNLFAHVVAETEKGVSFAMHHVVVVAQKPDVEYGEPEPNDYGAPVADDDCVMAADGGDETAGNAEN